MKYKELGNTGIKVSQICAGGMSFGKPSEDFHQWTLEQDDTKEMIRHAAELGVNFIDTANTYSHGTSEEYIGKAIKGLGIARDKVVLAWLLKRGVTAPIVGATSVPHFDDAVKAVDFNLADEDAAYLEEPYLPHTIVGAAAKVN